MIALPHRLRSIRESLGLTVNELAELSGIGLTTIYRIESGDDTHKINEDTAVALSTALCVEVRKIFEVDKLSHLGRPPHTGVAISHRTTKPHEVTCISCYMVVPRTAKCNNCETSLLSLVG